MASPTPFCPNGLEVGVVFPTSDRDLVPGKVDRCCLNGNLLNERAVIPEKDSSGEQKAAALVAPDPPTYFL